MNKPSQSPSNFTQQMTRDDLLLILATAYESASFRFLRQASLAWLTSYPGDLAVHLWLAKGLLAEGKPQQAQPVLEKLCRLDPEYSAALEVLAKVSQEDAPTLANQALASAHAVSIKGPTDVNMPNWIRVLRRARLLLQNGNIDEAEKIAQQVLGNEPDVILAAIFNVQLASARGDSSAVLNKTQEYRSRWPDCLQLALFEAEAQMETGDEVGAVNLLHKCVVNDAAAQVPARIWGEDFAYRPLWPDALEIKFELPVPADVAARLGWNLLPAANPQAHALDEDSIRIVEPPQVDTGSFYDPAQESASPVAEEDQVFPFLENLLAKEEAQGPVDQGSAREGSSNADDENDAGAIFSRPVEQPPAQAVGEPAVVEQPAQPEVMAQAAVNETVRSVQEEFERVAKHLKVPGLGRADGRFPVYVIFSTEGGLEKQYGAATLAVLDKELRRLSEVVRKRPGWDAIVYYPDCQSNAEKFGLSPVDAADPWKLKLALTDLDAALGKKGEMIGAVLIVGGPEVVPFHHLPNPTDDMDSGIDSDNPYATLDSNYFVPDWPVGRLPGETGPDAGLLLEGIRKLVRYHSKNLLANHKSRKQPDFWQRVQIFLQGRSLRNRKGSLGYTAAVWKRSSLAVYRTIGEAGSMLASPPQGSGSLPGGRKQVSLAYYNLHGMVDAAEWYGQRDITDASSGPDYPVALSPKDLSSKGHAPDIIFSEACYGAHVVGKVEDQAMALKFLAQGALAMVGSTSAAYGSVTTPLIGADLLGNFFWKSLKEGRTVGEALVQAKVDLVREMNKRQGFLDGEDQKTLISFVLYGDPLVSIDATAPYQHKSVMRSRLHPAVKTMSDQVEEGAPDQPVPSEMLKKVKGIVAEYLPGLENAEMRLQRQISGNGKHAQTAKSAPMDGNGRVVVTINKDVRIGQKIHHQYARVTLDGKGKMVKLALSR